MKAALVTGAQGFVGRHAVAALLAEGYRVTGTGRAQRQDEHFSHDFAFAGRSLRAPLPAGLAEAIDSDRYTYVACDLADAGATAALVRSVSPERVVHLAGALRDEAGGELLRANVVAAANLAGAVAGLEGDPLLVLGSSGSVFGDQEALPIAEDATPRPIGDYAGSKHAGEQAALAVVRGTKLRLVVARVFNIVGPGLQPRHLPAYLAHRIAEIEATGEAPVIEIGPLSATRDLVDVRDVARFCVAVSQPGTVNVATGRETAMAVVAALLAGASTVPIQFRTRPERARVGADRSCAAIPTMRALGLPGVALEQSLADMLAYARLAAR